MFNPLDLAVFNKDIVSGSDGRKEYYRFRASRFYGGIATADCIGCCLECVFCWSWEATRRPREKGQFYTPEDVVTKLLAIARKKKYKRLRISGSEPTLDRSHLERVLELVPEEYGEVQGLSQSIEFDFQRAWSLPFLYKGAARRGDAPRP